jgi:hypothetical protein
MYQNRIFNWNLPGCQVAWSEISDHASLAIFVGRYRKGENGDDRSRELHDGGL